jgi:hypothetical protein
MTSGNLKNSAGVAMNDLRKTQLNNRDNHVWEQGWDDHKRRQMQRLAALSLEEKLDWLEQAHRLILHMQSKQSVSHGRD